MRIEDLDTPRVVPGAADAILATLEAFGFEWDGEPLWQSARLDAYHEAIHRLRAAGRLYPCTCSRRELSGPYPGTCRSRRHVEGDHALRLRLPDDEPLAFRDRWQGPRHHDPASLGDPVILRRDGVVAYQLAVVVDDAFQGVTDVVRGADLLDSTPWQLSLQAALGLPHPGYAHVPVLTEPDGGKLSKSRRSVGLDRARAGAELWQALDLLRQQPPTALLHAPAREVLAWALANWRPAAFAHRAEIAVSERRLGPEAGPR